MFFFDEVFCLIHINKGPSTSQEVNYRKIIDHSFVILFLYVNQKEILYTIGMFFVIV